jgi:hypothetical protein
MIAAIATRRMPAATGGEGRHLGEASSYIMTPTPADANIKPEVLKSSAKVCDVRPNLRHGGIQFKNDDALQQLGVYGKTGTAQDGLRPTHAWFVSYAHAIILKLQWWYGENGGEGSAKAPISRDIMDYFFFQTKH